MGLIQRKIRICLNNFLDQTCKRGEILQKNNFLRKLSHIQLNFAFLLFWSIFWEIHRELLFLVKKVTISEKSTEIIRNFFFLTCLKIENPDENLDLFKQIFLIKPVKGDKY